MSDMRSRIHAVLGGLSILIIGAVLGMTIDRHVLLPATAAATSSPAGRIGPTEHAAALADLARDLRLTEEQTAYVHRVFLRYQATIDSAWNGMQSRIVGVVDSATAEIETVLDAEQRTLLHEWIAGRHAAHRRRH